MNDLTPKEAKIIRGYYNTILSNTPSAAELSSHLLAFLEAVKLRQVVAPDFQDEESK